MTPEEGLADAIVYQAAKDYRSALKKLKRHGFDTYEDGVKRECESFFRSPWFRELTKIDGEKLIKDLKEEVEEQWKQKSIYHKLAD